MGGGTISFFNMLFSLMEKGIEPIVVCPHNLNPTFKEITNQHKIKVIESFVPKEIWPPTDTFRDKVLFAYRFLKMFFGVILGEFLLNKIIKKERPQIIHTNYGVVHQGYHLAKKHNIPHVWHIREYQDLDFKWKIFPSKERMLEELRDNNHVICITNNLLKHFQLTNHPNATCIYNGMFSSKDVCCDYDKENYFLCSSRISPEKGLDDAISAFSMFCKKNKDYTLKILGNPSTPQYLESLKRKAADLGISDRILWEGFQSDVKPYMKKAKALIVASHFEGLGRMTAEAGLLGCIPIGRNTGGTKEIIDNMGGMLFNNVEQLSQCMTDIVDMPANDYSEMATSIQTQATSLFTNEICTQKTYSIYQKILENA